MVAAQQSYPFRIACLGEERKDIISSHVLLHGYTRHTFSVISRVSVSKL